MARERQKQVVIYGMGRDGSAPIYDSLAICDRVSVRQVYTLDRVKVTNMMLRPANTVPEHILTSERILREDMAKDTPVHFITMVHEPFRRHVRQSFYQLQHNMDADVLGYSLAYAKGAAQHFRTLPPEYTTKWFNDEYQPATGIDVYAHRFDHEAGYHQFLIGPHRLMLLSAHLPRDKQAKIISDFLGVNIPPILAESQQREDLHNLYLMQVLRQEREQIQQDFWSSAYARHFFSPEQMADFEGEAEEIAHHALGKISLEEQKSLSTRENLLNHALSPLSQLPDLTAEIAVLLKKRNVEPTLRLIDGILRHLDRARNNLLLAAVRAAAAEDTASAVQLGENWLEQKKDERIIKTLAAFTQKNSQITRPIELLRALPQHDEKSAKDLAMLEAQKRLLNAPFPFSPRAKAPAVQPREKSILYNPHQSLPFHTSGYATRTHGIVKALKEAGWNINIVARAGYPADTGIDIAGHLPDNDIDGVPYHYDLTEGQGQWDLPVDHYVDHGASYLVEQAKDIRPALLHTASNFMCGLAGIEAARRLGIPSIYEVRGLWHITRWSKEPEYGSSEKFALAQKMELEAAAGADHVLAITGALKEWLVDNGINSDKISLAPNAVDLSQFTMREPDAEFAAQHGLAGKIVVGYIGSFVQYEGLDLLVQAVAMLPADQRERVRLLWIGDGPVLPDLLEMARDTGISENIVSLGRRPFDEVPRAYSIVDIAVFPRKGQVICEIVSPLKPFEAMAMKKAVLVSDVRPLKEIIIPEKTGLIHAKDDPQSLASQLSRFITDEKLRASCGAAAREWIEQTRNWPIIARQVADVYRKLT